MSDRAWSRLLLRSLKSSDVDFKLLEYVDELLLWVSYFNPSEDYLVKKTIVIAGGSKARARAMVLRLIDQLILQDEQDVYRIFGEQCFIESGNKRLKKRYSRLSRVFHPDRRLANAEWLNKRMIVINHAYELARAQQLNSSERKKKPVAKDDFDIDVDKDFSASTDSYWDEGVQESSWSKVNYYFNALLYRLFGYSHGGKVRRKAFKYLFSFALLLFMFGSLYQAFYERKQFAAQSSQYAKHHQLQGKQGVESVNKKQESSEKQLAGKQSIPLQMTDQEIERYLDQLLQETSSKHLGGETGLGNKYVKPEVAHPNIQEMFEADKVREAKKPKKKQLSKEVKSKLNVSRQKKIVNESNLEGKKKLSDYSKVKAVHKVLAQKELKKRSAPYVSELQGLLNNLEKSFSAKSARGFADNFLPSGYYFGEKGVDAIYRERKRFFDSVSSARMQIKSVAYKELKAWHYVEVEMRVMFRVNDKELKSCRVVELLVNRVQTGYKIFSMTQKKGQKCQTL